MSGETIGKMICAVPVAAAVLLAAYASAPAKSPAPAHAKAAPGTPPTQASGAISRRGYLLRQTSRAMGTQTVNISQKGIYCSNKKTGMSVIARAPKWDIVTYNESTKTCISKPLKDYRGLRVKFVSDFMKTNVDYLPFYFKEQNIENGLCLRRFTTVELLSKKQAEKLKAQGKTMTATMKLSDGEVISADLKVLDDKSVPPEISHFLSKFYGVPKKPGIPVSLRYERSTDGQLKKILDTKSIARSDNVLIPSELPGFTKTTSEKEFFGDSKTEGTMQDFLKYMDQRHK